MKTWRFLTKISLYFENGTMYGYIYNARRILTCMRSIESNGVISSRFQGHDILTSNDSKMVKDRDIVTTAEVVCDLSIGTNFNDPERPLTQVSKSRQYSTLNISLTVEHRGILTMKDEQELIRDLSNVPFPMTFSDL